MKRTIVPKTELLTLIARERLSLATFLKTLTDAEWASPSMCPGWSVHEVVAHLTLSTRESPWQFMRSMLKARGDMDKAFLESARHRGRQFSSAELVAQIRDDASSKKHLLGSTPEDRLIDVQVHAQDIARAIGRAYAFSNDGAIPLLDRVWKSSFYGGKRRFPDTRLVATDVAWSAGEGSQEMRDSAEVLLLRLLGRKV